VAALFHWKEAVMANRRVGVPLTPEIILKRLKKVKATVDKGKITDFSKMCERSMHNVYVGPILRKHGAVARKGKGEVYHWNGLAINLKFAKKLLTEIQKRTKKRQESFVKRKAEKQAKQTKPPQIKKEAFTEALTDEHLAQIADMVAEKTNSNQPPNNDELLHQLNIRLDQQYSEVLELFKSCVRAFNELDSINSQISMLYPVEAGR